jgi:CRP-like cAMP-binding protein
MQRGVRAKRGRSQARSAIHRIHAEFEFANRGVQPPALDRAALRPMAADGERPHRIGCDAVMPMTHEFLSTMLGVRRAGVTVTAQELQRSGLIRYFRGEVTIIDHDGLAEAACECYRIDHVRFERLCRPA